MKFLKLTDKLTFGKYKGKTVDSVRREDPEYLGWAIANKVISLGAIDEQFRKIHEEEKLDRIVFELGHEDREHPDEQEEYYGISRDDWGNN